MHPRVFMSYWRAKAEPIIAGIIVEVGTDDPAKLRKAIRSAYPFGARKNHPYKIWCSEVRRQLEKTPARVVYITKGQAALKPACINCRQRNQAGECTVERRKVGDFEFCRSFVPVKAASPQRDIFDD